MTQERTRFLKGKLLYMNREGRTYSWMITIDGLAIVPGVPPNGLASFTSLDAADLDAHNAAKRVGITI